MMTSAITTRATITPATTPPFPSGGDVVSGCTTVGDGVSSGCTRVGDDTGRKK